MLKPLVLFRVADQVTGEPRSVRRLLLGVEVSLGQDRDFRLLRDFEILATINRLSLVSLRTKASYHPETDAPTVVLTLDTAQHFIDGRLGDLGFPFKIPVAEQLAVLWPARPGRQEEADAEEDSQIEP